MLSEEKLFLLVKKNAHFFQETRRYFHRFPELGFQEWKTTEEIGNALRKLKIEPEFLEPTGVSAYVGPEKGTTIALRADIDGLFVKEETNLPFASCADGRMHACGHDGHIAALLGAAAILKEWEDQLEVRVKLIFQPSEENTLGAKKIISQGILADVDYIFGLHLFSDMDTGVISVEGGPRMAQTDRFSITFYGKGGHAGKPHQCVDATVMASDFVMNVQTIAAREIDPVQGAVVTIGSFHSGTQYNVISGEARVEGTCRSFSETVAKKIQGSIERRARAIAEAYGGRVEIDYDYGSHPPVENDGPMAKAIARLAGQWLEETRLTHIAPLMLGEDFSWYQKKVPGVFAFVGCKKAGEEECYPNHHPKFDMDESALSDAVMLHLLAVMAAEKGF